MHNLLILGSGRSGTSMVAGLFRHAGVNYGGTLLQPTVANPTGYWEAHEVNHLNNHILQRHFRHRLTRHLPDCIYPSAHKHFRALWLAAPARLSRRPTLPRHVAQIQAIVHQTPFCLKDPRFNNTLPDWVPHLPENTRFLVVFRDAFRTVRSILRDGREHYTPPLRVTPRWATLQWMRGYERLLQWSTKIGARANWMFISYDDVASLSAIAIIEAFAATPVDSSEIDPRYSRTSATSTQNDQIPIRYQARCQSLLSDLAHQASLDRKRLENGLFVPIATTH